jgi:glutamate carboxypeptidase
MMYLLRRFVELESPSTDKSALDRTGKLAVAEWTRRGAEVRLLRRKMGGDLVRATLRAPRSSVSSRSTRRQLLVLGHLDTVYPLGTLKRMPFRIASGRAFGPGIYDMKAGIVMALFAVDALRQARVSLNRSVVFLWTTDEEIGSAASRAEIERQAARSHAVLVLEPSLGPQGLLKTARKGVGEFELRVSGKSAHAGVNPRDGVNAAHELAMQTVRVAGWSNPRRGLTLQPTVIFGGTFSNVIPDFAACRMDVRFTRKRDAHVIENRLRHLRPILKGARLEVRGGINRPPLERTPAVRGLFSQAEKIGRILGLHLKEGPTGGGSDGNFTAALGVPTLDGLGAVGHGAHTPGEFILLRALPERAALLAGLLATL